MGRERTGAKGPLGIPVAAEHSSARATPLHVQSSHTTVPFASPDSKSRMFEPTLGAQDAPSMCEKQSPEGKGGVFVTQQAGGRARPAPKLSLSWLHSACVPQPGHSQSLPHRKHFLSVWVTAMCPFSKPNACLKAPRTCCSLSVGGSQHPQGSFSQDTQVSAHKVSSSERPILTLFCCSLHLNSS